jgi:hypothetical protein
LQVLFWTVDIATVNVECNAKYFDSLGVAVHVSSIEAGYSPARIHEMEINESFWRVAGLDPCPNRLRQEFFNEKIDEMSILGIHAVYCRSACACILMLHIEINSHITCFVSMQFPCFKL